MFLFVLAELVCFLVLLLELISGVTARVAPDTAPGRHHLPSAIIAESVNGLHLAGVAIAGRLQLYCMQHRRNAGVGDPYFEDARV